MFCSKKLISYLRIHKEGVWYPSVSNFGHNPGHGDVYVHVSMQFTCQSNFTHPLSFLLTKQYDLLFTR